MKNDVNNNLMPVLKDTIPTLSRFRTALRSRLNKTSLIISEVILIGGIIVTCVIYFR